MAATLGTLNPFRYRHYVYDEETGLYYLRSRYYHPDWQRFLNADAHFIVSSIHSSNLFAYCTNNPIAYVDLNGDEGYYYQTHAYSFQAAIMQLHDYRNNIISGLGDKGYKPAILSQLTDMQLYNILVDEVAATMTWTSHPSMSIPNNTSAMELLQEIVIYSNDYSYSGKYYALDIANACRERYKHETNSDFPISCAKIALEIRLHYNAYSLLKSIGIDELHTRHTDVSLDEGNFFQLIIDMLYDLGVK